jgi:hypothetical protein
MGENAVMTASVDVPVTADIEAGYGTEPRDIAETTWRSPSRTRFSRNPGAMPTFAMAGARPQKWLQLATPAISAIARSFSADIERSWSAARDYTAKRGPSLAFSGSLPEAPLQEAGKRSLSRIAVQRVGSLLELAPSSLSRVDAVERKPLRAVVAAGTSIAAHDAQRPVQCVDGHCTPLSLDVQQSADQRRAISAFSVGRASSATESILKSSMR